jgi:hypothetical protein
MKIFALSLSILGLMCLIMSVLTAFEVCPAVINTVGNLGSMGTNAIFWGGLSGLLFLGGISVGMYANREF